MSHTIRVPSTINVNLHTSNGSIDASNRIGATDIHTSNGSITAHNITGSIRMKTSNGAVTAQNLNATDALDIHSSNGALMLRLASAKNIRNAYIKTSNGVIDVAVAKTLQATLHGKTSNGKVSGNVWQRHLNKHNSEAEATLGDGSMYMDIRTSNGRINANYMY